MGCLLIYIWLAHCHTLLTRWSNYSGKSGAIVTELLSEVPEPNLSRWSKGFVTLKASEKYEQKRRRNTGLLYSLVYIGLFVNSWYVQPE